MGASATSGDVVLRAVDLTKTWGDGSGLRPVSFELRSGEIAALKGRSGSGKSTVLALLAGWWQPDGGRIERIGAWAGGDGWTRYDRTAVVPQTLALLGELSLEENVRMAHRSSGGADVDALLDVLGLREHRRRRPPQVSLGQAQRAAVARGLVAQPVLILVDEPTSHQDAANAHLVVDALRAAADRGTAVLVASHDERMIDAADRVIDLDDDGAGTVTA